MCKFLFDHEESFVGLVLIDHLLSSVVFFLDDAVSHIPDQTLTALERPATVRSFCQAASSWRKM
jgi:hypothetical protein